jgi:hypothetical protein
MADENKNDKSKPRKDPAFTNNVPFDEGQFETDKKLPKEISGSEDIVKR